MFILKDLWFCSYNYANCPFVSTTNSNYMFILISFKYTFGLAIGKFPLIHVLHFLYTSAQTVKYRIWNKPK